MLMVGPAADRKGGIATITRTYLQHWDSERFDLKFIVSTGNTTKVGNFLRFLGALVEYCYQLLIWRPEIVHIHFGWGASYYRKSVFIILARFFPVKTLLHCHTGRFNLLYEGKNSLVQRYIIFSLQSADLILVVSEALKNYFAGLSLGVPVFFLNNSVEIPRASDIQRSQGTAILTMGRLSKLKGTYDILQAAPRVIARKPDVEFWLAGVGDIDAVKKIISRHAWGKNIRLLGWIEGQAKQAYLAQANIFLLPSYHEGTPIAILEAMAYGLPIISTPVGGIPSLITDGETGFLITPGDVDVMVEKLLILLDDKSLCRKIGAAGQELIRKNFDIDHNLQRLYSFYDSLLNGTISCTEKLSMTEP